MWPCGHVKSKGRTGYKGQLPKHICNYMAADFQVESGMVSLTWLNPLTDIFPTFA